MLLPAFSSDWGANQRRKTKYLGNCLVWVLTKKLGGTVELPVKVEEKGEKVQKPWGGGGVGRRVVAVRGASRGTSHRPPVACLSLAWVITLPNRFTGGWGEPGEGWGRGRVGRGGVKQESETGEAGTLGEEKKREGMEEEEEGENGGKGEGECREGGRLDCRVGER